MDVMNFIPDALFILVVATNMMGIFLKQIGYVKDNFIPILLLAFSIIFSVAMLGFSPEVVLQGIVTWGTAVGIHQTVHQLTSK